MTLRERKPFEAFASGPAEHMTLGTHITTATIDGLRCRVAYTIGENGKCVVESIDQLDRPTHKDRP